MQVADEAQLTKGTAFDLKKNIKKYEERYTLNNQGSVYGMDAVQFSCSVMSAIL